MKNERFIFEFRIFIYKIGKKEQATPKASNADGLVIEVEHCSVSARIRKVRGK